MSVKNGHEQRGKGRSWGWGAGRQGSARKSQGPVCTLVGRGKGLCGAREDSDCSAKVCVDPVVGTGGVRRGRGLRGSSGRHVDSSGAREERGGGVS